MVLHCTKHFIVHPYQRTQACLYAEAQKSKQNNVIPDEFAQRGSIIAVPVFDVLYILTPDLNKHWSFKCDRHDFPLQLRHICTGAPAGSTVQNMRQMLEANYFLQIKCKH